MARSSAKLEPFWEYRILLSSVFSDDVGAMMMEEGACGTHVTSYKQPEALGHASLGPAAATSMQGSQVEAPVQDQATSLVVATFDQHHSRAEVAEMGQAALRGMGLAHLVSTAVIARRDDTDWAFAWRQYFKPMKLGRRIWVVPSWEHKFLPPTGSVTLRIDPGMAFGTGQHATTALCLSATEIFLDQATPQQRRDLAVLDVGCGSGILAMAALLLGAGHATLIDIDPDATHATQQNLDSAGLGKGRSAVLTGTLDQVEGSFGLVLANILAPVVMALAPLLVRRLAPGALLVVSGILAEQADLVRRRIELAAKSAGIILLAQRLRRHDDWVALPFLRAGH